MKVVPLPMGNCLAACFGNALGATAKPPLKVTIPSPDIFWLASSHRLPEQRQSLWIPPAVSVEFELEGPPGPSCLADTIMNRPPLRPFSFTQQPLWVPQGITYCPEQACQESYKIGWYLLHLPEGESGLKDTHVRTAFGKLRLWE